MLKAPRVEAEHRRKLPEERTELLAQRQHARGEEVRERLLDALQPQHVRDVARALHGVDKPAWRGFVPFLVVLRALERIKRAVDLDAAEVPRGEFELAALRQSFGV